MQDLLLFGWFSELVGAIWYPAKDLDKDLIYFAEQRRLGEQQCMRQKEKDTR